MLDLVGDGRLPLMLTDELRLKVDTKGAIAADDSAWVVAPLKEWMLA